MSEPSAELSPRESDPRPLGAVIGERYELRRVLGRGAMAVVFAAEHVRVKRAVALKLPRTDPELREVLAARLRRETDALARVRHPAIVDVIDAGESDGSPFLAMELLEGRTLSGLIAARGRLQADETVKIGIALAQGLAAVHASGLVHRDVKPANVLVTRARANQVHLCDFGMAKALAPAAPHAAKLTQIGAIVGTPEYMSIEALMASDQADQRADVYSLGVMLFECLTGAVPAEGSLAQILQRLTTSRTPRVSDVRSDVPAPLSAIVARCLEHEPTARYASMVELGEALVACMPVQPDAIDLLRADTDPAAEPAAEPAAAAPAVDPKPSFTARRGHSRAPYLTVCSLQRESGAAKSARMEDISEGGVLLVSEHTYVTGEVVRVRFSLPISGRVIALPATVRWTRMARTGPATGLEFTELPDGPRAEIRQYVALMGNSRDLKPRAAIT
jgi:serine/threonine-protein kinase